MCPTNTIGIGLIGCGRRGTGVAVRTARLDDRLQVRALYDPDADSIAAARKRLDCDPTVHESAAELVARPDIDWVMIGSWNSLHREHAVAAFEAGKHVFCEKPLATTLEDCVAMVDAWKASGKTFTIGFTLRYSPHYRKIHELIQTGAVGRLISMEFNETLGFNHGGYIHGDWRRYRRLAGTHLLEKCCHDVDLANWMVGSRVKRVASFGGLDFFTPGNAHHLERLGTDANGKKAYRTWHLPKKNVDPFTAEKDIIDNQVAILEYENGVRSTFHTNCNAGIPERRMVLLGSEGAIRADVLTGTIQVARIGFDEEIRDAATDARGGHGGGDGVLAEELKTCMLGGPTPSAGMAEALTSAITCFAIDDAMDSGAVIDATPYWNRAGL